VDRTLIPALLLVGVAAVLSACGGETEPETMERRLESIELPLREQTQSTASDEVPDVLSAQLDVARYDLDGMIGQGVLRVLVGYSHTHYFMDGMNIRGISAENLRRFDPFLHTELDKPKPRINILPIPVARDEMIDFLADGLADMAVGNITVTDERAARVVFSRPVRRDVSELIVHGAGVTGLESLEDLAGRSVHVRRSSSFFGSLTALNQAFLDRGLAPVSIVQVDEHMQTEDVLELVNAGVVPTTVADSHMAEFWSGIHESIVVRQDLALVTGRQIAWAIRKELSGLKPIVDGFIRSHREGTLVGNVLFQRYLQNNRYVQNASASDDRKRFQELTALFQRYSQDYDFDWLLIAAQGYQESQLIQSRRSPAGAIGVMQLLPSTAMGPAVNIPDIEELEANIHAGHKYLRHIADHYFSDAEIDELNRHLFSFAAYNAGPTRIMRLRREAARRGLDENQWFGHVERVVAEKVGMEPVTYVRNIFKYYVTYKLMQEQQAEDLAP